jgi:hypothetical protein
MNNIFADFDVGIRFDLKGSTIGRRTIKEEKGMRYDEPTAGGRNPKNALKDLDFIKYVGKVNLASSKCDPDS